MSSAARLPCSVSGRSRSPSASSWAALPWRRMSKVLMRRQDSAPIGPSLEPRFVPPCSLSLALPAQRARIGSSSFRYPNAIVSLDMAPRILVVEDEPAIAESVAYALGRDGFSVTLAASVSSAATLADGADLVVLDLMLPDGSGFDLITAWR